MPEHNDPMTNTLDTLRSDVERLPLSDSLTVRRRGDRRTRNQAVGGALAVVALLAGAAGIYGGLGGDDEATNIPASPTPTPEPTVALASAPLLRPSDFTELGRYSSGGSLLASPDAPDLSPPAEACQVRPNAWGAQQTYAKGYYQDGSPLHAVEVVLRYDTAERAKAALDQPGIDLAGCPNPDPAEGNLEVRPPETMAGVGDGVHMSRFFTPSAASEPSYYEVAAARTGNVVVVLTWAADDTPSGNPDTWAWSGDQLQTALDRAVD
jgi:hypothetical protein